MFTFYVFSVFSHGYLIYMKIKIVFWGGDPDRFLFSFKCQAGQSQPGSAFRFKIYFSFYSR